MMLLCQKFGTWGPGPLTCVEVAFFPFNHNDGDFLYTAASPSLKSSMLRFCSFSKSRINVTQSHLKKSQSENCRFL